MGFTFGSYFLEIKVPLILIVHVYYMAFWFLSLSLSPRSVAPFFFF